MKTLIITDELADKLHTIYEHYDEHHTIYEHYDEHKHHIESEENIEAEADIAMELAKQYHEQEKI